MNRFLLCFVLLAGAVLLPGCGGDAPKPGVIAPPLSPATTEATATTGVTDAPRNVVFPVKIVLEAEEFTTIQDKHTDGTVVMMVKHQKQGAPISFIDIPDGFIKTCGLEDKKGAGKLPGRASYAFDVPRDDTYYLFLRAQWMDDCGNSLWVYIDQEPWYSIEDQLGLNPVQKTYSWAWHPLFLEGTLKGYKLKAGKHTLWINVREDGPKLDQFVISTETSQVGEAAKKPKSSE